MNKYFFLNSLLISFCSFACAQSNTLIVKLKTLKDQHKLSTFTDIYNQNNSNFSSSIIYKGVPADVESSIIKVLDFQPAQGVYDMYLRLNGQMSKESLEQGLKLYGFKLKDTINFSRIPIKHFISFLVGETFKKQIVIIGDANNNYNFGDDMEIVFDSSILSKSFLSGKDTYKTEDFYYQYVYNGNIINSSVLISMSPIHHEIKYSDSLEQRFYLIVSLAESKIGNFKVGNISGKILVSFSKFPSPFYDSANSQFFFKGFSKQQYYNIGDTVNYNHRKYLLHHITHSGDSLYLSYIDNAIPVSGVYLNENAFNIICKDLIHNSPFNLQNLKGHYVLLDFWGSWCKPCLESIPELVEFSKSFGDKLKIVNVAVDSVKNLGTLKRIILDKKMRWTQLFQDINNRSKNSIPVKYKVNLYPTQILIDPNGKIIYRSDFNKSKLTLKQLNGLLK